MKYLILFFSLAVLFSRCNADQNQTQQTNDSQTTNNSYFDYTTPTPFQQAGERMIPLKEGYEVLTKII